MEIIKSGRFDLYYGSGYYPYGGFADYQASYNDLEEAKKAADLAFRSFSGKYRDVEWAEVVDSELKKRVYGLGFSCYFNYGIKEL